MITGSTRIKENCPELFTGYRTCDLLIYIKLTLDYNCLLYNFIPTLDLFLLDLIRRYSIYEEYLIRRYSIYEEYLIHRYSIYEEYLIQRYTPKPKPNQTSRSICSIS